MKHRTTGEAAELLQVDRTTIWRWVKDGRFAETRRKGFSARSHILISPGSIVAVAKELGMSEADLKALGAELEM